MERGEDGALETVAEGREVGVRVELGEAVGRDTHRGKDGNVFGAGAAIPRSWCPPPKRSCSSVVPLRT